MCDGTVFYSEQKEYSFYYVETKRWESKSN